MIKTATIDCFGAQLEVPEFVTPFWPYELPLNKWPSFCGAGDGLGDRLVPDNMYFNKARGGVDTAYLQPACFVHDLAWAICPADNAGFDWSNDMLLRNLNALVNAQLNCMTVWFARLRCRVYYEAVVLTGRHFFKTDPDDCIVCTDPLAHPVVRSKINRLLLAAIKNKPERTR